MQALLNALKAQATALDQSGAQPRFGLVSSVDPATYTARVLFQPEGVLSGWLPICCLWGGSGGTNGNGWGLVCPPQPGQQVLVIAQEGEAEHGIILGTAYAGDAQPPAAPAGEWWLVHASGSAIRLHNDGSIAIAGNTTLTGNLTVTGDIADAGGAHGTLAALRQAHDAHTHTGPFGGPTNPPNLQV